MYREPLHTAQRERERERERERRGRRRRRRRSRKGGRIERETLGSARLAVAHISPAALSAKAEGLGETNIHKRERRMKASKTRV
jgi:hypothetical protein